MNAALRIENRARSQVNMGARRVILLALSCNLITKFHSSDFLTTFWQREIVFRETVRLSLFSFKQLLHSVFVISGVITVSVSVISLMP